MQNNTCSVCGYVYDPAEGDPYGKIAPGTTFKDLPDDWVCPVCGAGKSEFIINDKTVERLARVCREDGIVTMNIFDVPYSPDEFYARLEKAGLEVKSQIGDIITIGSSCSDNK